MRPCDRPSTFSSRAALSLIIPLLLVALITIGCPPDNSVEAENGVVVRAVFSDAWSKGNVELIRHGGFARATVVDRTRV